MSIQPLRTAVFKHALTTLAFERVILAIDSRTDVAQTNILCEYTALRTLILQKTSLHVEVITQLCTRMPYLQLLSTMSKYVNYRTVWSSQALSVLLPAIPNVHTLYINVHDGDFDIQAVHAVLKPTDNLQYVFTAQQPAPASWRYAPQGVLYTRHGNTFSACSNSAYARPINCWSHQHARRMTPAGVSMDSDEILFGATDDDADWCL